MASTEPISNEPVRSMTDIRPQTKQAEDFSEPSEEPVFGAFSLRPVPDLTRLPVRRGRLRRILPWVLGSLALVISGIAIAGYVYLSRLQINFRDQVAANWDNLSQRVLLDYQADPNSSLARQTKTNYLPMAEVANIFGQALPFFQNGTQVIQHFQSTAALMVALGREVDHLLSGLPSYLLDHQGQELLASLTRLRDILKDMESETEQLSESAGKLGNKTVADTSFLVPIRAEASRNERLLTNLITWLGGNRRVVVLLENPSEIRPTGGFLGGYVDVTLENGSVREAVFRDINEVDRGRGQKIIPPLPIQAIARSWRTADANWFVSFPDSGKKIADFMDSSSLYLDKASTVDAVIAVTPKAVSDLLRLTGPIELPNSKQIITADNFLEKIQTEVQSGQASDSEYPKQVLKDLLPIFLERLKTLAGGSKTIPLVLTWVKDREVMAYFRDTNLQNAGDVYGISGRLFDLPTDWNGGYLSVVTANLGGGKSDLYIKDSVTLQVQVQLDGIISNHLTLAREHQGVRAKDWWYKVDSERYLRVLAPVGARVTHADGIWERTVVPKVKYSSDSSYAADPEVKNLESNQVDNFSVPGVTTGSEAGKTAFGFWLKTPLSTKRESTLDYQYRSFLPPQAGATYKFLVEREPGWNAEYKLEIAAPVGFRWLENDLPVFEMIIPAGGPAETTVEITLAQV